jgi:hypothetical protein
MFKMRIDEEFEVKARGQGKSFVEGYNGGGRVISEISIQRWLIPSV